MLTGGRMTAVRWILIGLGLGALAGFAASLLRPAPVRDGYRAPVPPR
jgi:hypothetical protein